MHLASDRESTKPRTYRKKTRKEYVSFSRRKRHTAKKIRKAVKKQLCYIERNLRSIDSLQKRVSLRVLDKALYRFLLISSEVARQQREMYDNKTKRIEHRIVNLAQPHIRPVKRGKVQRPTEFGAKLSISLVDGYSFIDNMSFDNYNESCDLIEAAESYKARFGYYPQSIHADQIYRNRNNIKWCNERNIRLSGPKLGRPPKKSSEETGVEKNQMRQDELDRIPVEGKFGQLKRRFGFDRIMTKLATTLSVISLTVLLVNLEKVRQNFLLFVINTTKHNEKRCISLFEELLRQLFLINETSNAGSQN